MTEFLKYYGMTLLLTLGTIVLCGFAVRLCAAAFARLMGSPSGAVFDITAVIGTPVHELGHAMMCPLFGHKVESMRLWCPRAENGVYGYVNHSYNRKNLWARLGNLFIGIGPIFSGMLVVILMLWLCFPTAWSEYLEATKDLSFEENTFLAISENIFSLFKLIPNSFSSHNFRSILGLIIILPISLHISLSGQDIKGSLSAIPLYLLLALIFSAITFLFGANDWVLSGLWLFNLRLLSLFSIVIAFSLVWVLIALLIKGIKMIF